jgi:hypothetical protein
MTVKIAPKTTWCQECIKEGEELHQILTQRGRLIRWVCDKCYKEIEKADRVRGIVTKVNPAQKAKMEEKKAKMEEENRIKDELAKKMEISKSANIRKIKPGEKFPEAKSVNYGNGAPLRSKPTPMDYFVGFRWSYGWGPKEDE